MENRKKDGEHELHLTATGNHTSPKIRPCYLLRSIGTAEGEVGLENM